MRAAAPGSTDLFTRHYVDHHHRDADGLIAERMRETGLVTVDGLGSRVLWVSSGLSLIALAALWGLRATAPPPSATEPALIEPD